MIVIQWQSFGTYHRARYDATRKLLRSEGISVTGLATADGIEGRPWKLQSSEGTGIQTMFPGRQYNTLSVQEKRLGMMTALDEINPQAVAICGYGDVDARSALDWCRRRKRRAILMTESKKDDARRSWIREFAKRKFVSRYTTAICAGSPQRDYLQQLKMPSDHIFEKYSVVDNDTFQEAAESHRKNRLLVGALPGLDDGVPYFLCSSRFIDRKNLQRLILAYQSYRDRVSEPWRLIILGIGTGRDDLVKTIIDRKIDDVVLPGFRQLNELTAYYAHAGALIHPALQEQWGLVVNEAMACGLPILISSVVGCAKDLVHNGVNGFHFDPLFVNEIARSMERMSCDTTDRRRMALESRRIIADWTPRHFAESMLSAIQLS